MANTTTVILKGEVITNPSDNNVGSAQFVHCTATSGAQTVIVKDSTKVGTPILGSAYLHAAGDTIIVEKLPTDIITLADGKVSSVGSELVDRPMARADVPREA